MATFEEQYSKYLREDTYGTPMDYGEWLKWMGNKIGKEPPLQEDYVSFETAKLLKEKGFNIHDDELIRRGWVNVHNNTWSFTSFGQEEHDTYKNEWALVRRATGGYVLSENEKDFYAAPTQALVLKWLRIKHGINMYYLPYVYRNKTMYEFRIDNHYYRSSGYKTPEEGFEQAIIYSLKNLVK